MAKVACLSQRIRWVYDVSFFCACRNTVKYTDVAEESEHVLVSFPKMHAPFHTCAPHPQARKATRTLTVDFSGEEHFPELQVLRNTLTNLSDRFQHVCNDKDNVEFSDFKSWTPTLPANAPYAPLQVPQGARFPFLSNPASSASSSSTDPMPHQLQLQRQNAKVLRTANVSGLIKTMDNSDWPDKVMLKFEPNEVQFTGEHQHAKQ